MGDENPAPKNDNTPQAPPPAAATEADPQLVSEVEFGTDGIDALTGGAAPAGIDWVAKADKSSRETRDR